MKKNRSTKLSTVKERWSDMPLYRRVMIAGGVCTALGAIYATYSLARTKSVETFGQWPYANRQELAQTRAFAEEIKALAQSQQQRLDTSERIQIQRDILKVEQDTRGRALTPAEQKYLADLRERLKELESRKK